MNTCKNCKYWENPKHLKHEGTCSHKKVDYRGRAIIDSIQCDGYECEGITMGPDFGCIHFEQRTEQEEK